MCVVVVVVRLPAKGTAEHLGDTAIREIRHHMETDKTKVRHRRTTRGQRQITEKPNKRENANTLLLNHLSHIQQ